MRRPRSLRSVVVFPIFGLAALLPKIQILVWSLGKGLALAAPDADHDAAFDLFDDDHGAGADLVDEYTA